MIRVILCIDALLNGTGTLAGKQDSGRVEKGQEPGNILVLLDVVLIVLGATVFFFQRPNITAGAWAWQRGKLPVPEI